jgi:hypothetical protein
MLVWAAFLARAAMAFVVVFIIAILVRIAVVFVITFIDIPISWKLAQEKKVAIVHVVALVVTLVVSSPVLHYFGLMLG